jgi:hypothetical protein
MRHRLLAPLATLAAMAVGALLLFGQGHSATASNRPQPALAAMPVCADSEVIFRLSTGSPVYLPGQSVRVTLEVRNAGSHWCKVAGQCDEVAPLTVFDSRRLLWSDKPCYNHEWDAVNIPLAPGRLVTYHGSWSTSGARAGWYEARAEFLKTAFLIL